MKTNYLTIFLITSSLCFILYIISKQYNNLDINKEYNFIKDKVISTQNKIFSLGDNLWNPKNTYDVKFIITDNNYNNFELYAHKNILATNSKHFHILFSNNSAISTIHYSNVSLNAFTSILELLFRKI